MVHLEVDCTICPEHMHVVGQLMCNPQLMCWMKMLSNEGRSIQ